MEIVGAPVLDDPELRICPTGRLPAGIDIYPASRTGWLVMVAASTTAGVSGNAAVGAKRWMWGPACRTQW